MTIFNFKVHCIPNLICRIQFCHILSPTFCLPMTSFINLYTMIVGRKLFKLNILFFHNGRIFDDIILRIFQKMLTSSYVYTPPIGGIFINGMRMFINTAAQMFTNT